MPRVQAEAMHFIGKSNKTTIKSLKTGANLEKRTGYSIDALISKATADRLQFARALLRAGKAATRGSTPSFRSATSRAYYSMYHALRATAFFSHQGDDNEAHSKLPSGLPADFPNREHWENDLKNARYERNRADYDPYPKNDVMFRSIADQLIEKADHLVPIVRAYLQKNGCRI